MYSLFYLTFLYWKVCIACLKSFFGYRPVSIRERETTVTLAWDKQKLQLNFKEFPKGFHEATVKDLKVKIKQLTDVPIALMKLQVSGANIKDDTATLTSAGVCKNSVIQLNGEKVDESVAKQTASGNPEEYGLMTRIAQITGALSDGTSKEIEEFEDMIKQVESKSKLNETEKKKLQDRGIYLSEKMMRVLISLDGVECPSEFQTAREKRREGVRLSQQLLERVDKSRTIVKELCKK